MNTVGHSAKKRRIRLGDKVKPYGKLACKYRFADGEEYYFFVSNRGRSVAMMPASTIDPMWEAQ